MTVVGHPDPVGGELSPTLALRLPAELESVPEARHAIADFAAAWGLTEERVYDLKTIVTEACANVVEHAYDGAPGVIELDAVIEEGGMSVTIRDHGLGMRPQPSGKPWSLRLGLVLIGTLASSFECLSEPGKGTELRIHVATT